MSPNLLPSEKKVIYLTNRSAAETDDQCGMKFWLSQKEAGTGIVPKEEPLALLIGRDTHEDLAAIAKMEDISAATLQSLCDGLIAGISEEESQFPDKMELLYRRMGWFVAFALYVEPTIRAKYENVSIEAEIALDRDPLWVAVTPDRILRSRSDRHLEYWEYKTTVSASNKWLMSWQYAIQLHLGLKAAEEELKIKPRFGQIIGLMKGYESPSTHRLMHPYAWGYFNFLKHVWSHEYKAGSDWVPLPVWEYPGGIVEWVKFCGEEVARAQFPMSPPVFLNTKMLDGWVARRLARERKIRAIEDICKTNIRLREINFEMRTSKCRPGFGDACPYIKACWNAEVSADPLASGDYVRRTPHHDMEIIGVD